MENRPRGRKKNVTQGSGGVFKRGSGLNGGPAGKRTTISSSGGSGTRSTRSSSPLMTIIILVFLLFGGGGGILSSLGDEMVAPNLPDVSQNVTIPSIGNQQSINATTAALDTSVAKGARDKYTRILGSGKDITTIMVYMCGTDLESKSGMATNDLVEMANAGSSDKINLIIYTGGCQRWQTSAISNKTNQVYQLKDGKLLRLVEDAGNKSMTDPATLSEFIRFCTKYYPANRYDLIFWDHGGGSIKGYGYDQNHSSSGSMTLAGIDQALKDGGVKYDFIGFDACLMATAENAMMLADHADYLIASEETEPGIGWYYTDWLKAYVKDPSIDTLSIGKNIIDSFVEECARKVSGQPATLSIVDLAEYAKIVPDKLKEWSVATSELIQNDEYEIVAKARQGAREFAQAKYDQCDFVDMMNKMGTDEAKELAKALQSSIKYNRTSANMSNAYGLSIYFPNRKPANVKEAANINAAIGMDEEFSSCLREYASLQLAGQSVAYGNGNSGNPLSSLFGNLNVTTSSGSETQQLLQDLFYSGLSSLLGGYDRSMSLEDTASYIDRHQLDASQLVFTQKDGNQVIELSEEQWSLITELELNMFYDDGEGYIDLGYDNVFDFDEKGRLLEPQDRTWLAINGQVVAYYHISTVDYGDDDYAITGYIPAYVNNERVDIIVVFDANNEDGYIAGTLSNYQNLETATMAKLDEGLKSGDVVEFVCDYYDYNGNYSNSFYLGNPLVIGDEIIISNVEVGAGAIVAYKFTDIYHQEYWSEVLK